MFTVPGEDEWSLVISKKTGEWERTIHGANPGPLRHEAFRGRRARSRLHDLIPTRWAPVAT